MGDRINAGQLAISENYFNGILLKRNSRGKKQERFCVVEGKHLKYFLSKKAIQETNVLDLASYNITLDGKEICLNSKSNGKNYNFIAESRELAEVWIDVFDNAIISHEMSQQRRTSLESHIPLGKSNSQPLSNKRNSYELCQLSRTYSTESTQGTFRPRNDSGFWSVGSDTSGRTSRNSIGRRPYLENEEKFLPNSVVYPYYLTREEAERAVGETPLRYIIHKGQQTNINILVVKPEDEEILQYTITKNKDNQFFMCGRSFISLLSLVMHFRENILPGTTITLCGPTTDHLYEEIS